MALRNIYFQNAPLLVLIFLSHPLMSQDRSQARSMVVTPLGIVATSHVQASQAGALILARGGSAVDAAIAANAVLGVTEPMMNGIGGDLFAIYWDARTKKLYGLNSSGWAPQGRERDAAIWHRLCHRPGNSRRLECVAPALRETGLERAVQSGDHLRTRRIRRAGVHSRLLAGFSRRPAEKSGERTRFLAGRQGA